MSHLTERVLVPERMDDPNVGRAELARSLAFIRFVNRRLGGAHVAIRHLARWLGDRPAPAKPVRILDLGTGSADIPIAIARWAKRRGVDVHITGIDLHETTLELAREHLAAQNDSLPIELVQHDALKLAEEFAPESFDYAHAGMFLHHLPDIEVMIVLRAMHRLSRHGLIWNDLVRGTVGRIGTRLFVRLLPGVPAMARHDAIVSVEAGFTKHEALDLANRVGLPQIQYRDYLFYRFTLTSEKVPGEQSAIENRP
jgi:SAM-dependent methyltransferase